MWEPFFINKVLIINIICHSGKMYTPLQKKPKRDVKSYSETSTRLELDFSQLDLALAWTWTLAGLNELQVWKLIAWCDPVTRRAPKGSSLCATFPAFKGRCSNPHARMHTLPDTALSGAVSPTDHCVPVCEDERQLILLVMFHSGLRIPDLAA